MAGLYWLITRTAVAVSAATPKTVSQVIAASNVRARIHRIDVTVSGAAAGSANALVEILRQNSGTFSSETVTKRNETDSETLQTTAKHTATVEPGTNVGLDVLNCSSIQGTASFLYTDQSPMYVKGGSYLGVRVTSPDDAASVNVRIEGEE